MKVFGDGVSYGWTVLTWQTHVVFRAKLLVVALAPETPLPEQIAMMSCLFESVLHLVNNHYAAKVAAHAIFGLFINYVREENYSPESAVALCMEHALMLVRAES